MATQSDSVPDERRNQYDVMMSYSHKDKALMEKITGVLENAGIRVWCDRHIDGGEKFLQQIGDKILHCVAVVAILSPSSLNSEFCRDEITMAKLYKKKIYPISLKSPSELSEELCENPDMALILCGIQWIILSSGGKRRNSQFRQLANAIKKLEMKPGNGGGTDEAANEETLDDEADSTKGGSNTAGQSKKKQKAIKNINITLNVAATTISQMAVTSDGLIRLDPSHTSAGTQQCPSESDGANIGLKSGHEAGPSHQEEMTGSRVASSRKRSNQKMKAEGPTSKNPRTVSAKTGGNRGTVA